MPPSIEYPVSQFGLANDLISQVRRVEKNVRVASANIYHVLSALEQNNDVDMEVVIRLLRESREALDAVAL